MRPNLEYHRQFQPDILFVRLKDPAHLIFTNEKILKTNKKNLGKNFEEKNSSC